MKKSWFIPAIVWFITSTILLTLPGDDLPSTEIFGIENFDKLVHLGMFSLLTFLFSYPFLKAGTVKNKFILWTMRIAFMVMIYGILMEFIQKYWAKGRAFDYSDILFDCIGSIMGGIALHILGKKIGPDRNRGRNQN